MSRNRQAFRSSPKRQLIRKAVLSAAGPAHEKRWAAASFLLPLCLLPLSSGQVLAQSTGQTLELQPVEVIATSPGEGGAVASDKIPALVQSVGSEQIARTHSPNITDALQKHVAGAIAIDQGGNGFSQEFYYRGFVASPVEGRLQGLAVYENGVRQNEAFGDTVNWDLIPPQAIYRADVFTNNPLFGLNALGGAVNLEMKNGFLWQGFQGQVMGGSYGRISSSFQYGMKKDNFSLYVTSDAVHDDGWRYHSPSSLVRIFGDLGYRSQDAELHFVATGASTHLGAIGPTPVQLLSQDDRSIWTNPQTTANQAGSVAFNGKFDISPTWTVQSNFYLRSLQQRRTDGNDANFGDCGQIAGGAPTGILCDSDNSSPIVDQQGNLIASVGAASATFPYGAINHTAIHANTVGANLQATNKDKILDHPNQITFGASVDRSWLNYNATTTLGVIGPDLTVTNGSIPGGGQVIQDQNNQNYVQTYLSGTPTYFGLYALDTLDITPKLSLTAGARFNAAIIETRDQSGMDPELNATNRFERLNPVVGLTYKILPNLTAYAGYSEANRAPTPLELDCSDPARPCVLASSLVSDPPLSQVVARTVEGGLRGNLTTPNDGRIDWKAGYFRTQNSNDIIQLSSQILGTGYYTNVPETLRQGAEASAEFKMGALEAFANYSYVDATYQFAGTLASPNNPQADAAGNIFVVPGNHIPGIPRHQAKLGVDYAFTPKFKAGADVLIVGSQYYIGDDSNQNPQLPAYWVANLHASYQVTDHMQIFGLVNNVFNNHYATYGTFFDLGSSAQLALASALTDPRMISPAQPLSLYGGVKVTF